MKTIKIIAEKDIRTTDQAVGKRARKITKQNFENSQLFFNNLCEKLNNTVIDITRNTQALEVFCYSHATAPGTPPAYWNASLQHIEKNIYKLVLVANYRNTDDIKCPHKLTAKLFV